ncbi:MAG TPA: DUF3717 domain-containing protein [Burkholderiaceae bacterium]|nr:DUF3717 domain-containing protein [Burkholderiaceae bacterium]
MTSTFTIADLETAINYWRSKSPSRGEELALCPEASALAEPYALMIVQHVREIPADSLDAVALEALESWRQQSGPEAAQP